jgi:Ca2+-transporting ATPase
LLARAATVLGEDLRPTLADEADRDAYLGEAARLAGQGLRVVATGRCDIRLEAFVPSADLLPLVDRLTLLALVGMVDPPRPEARASVAAARTGGLRVVMLTADGPAAAGATARRLGLDETDAIAHATPARELRLVDALRADGCVVALVGDAIRDAPALTAADVGIATGRGTEVASESAAILLADGSLAAILSAVDRGGTVAAELARCVRFHAGVLAGLVFTFVGASALNIAGGVPFVPLQTLFLTLAVVAPLSILFCPAAPVRRTVALAAVRAAATLAVIAIAENEYGTATARILGLATFALLSLLEAAITRIRRCADPGAE